MGVTLDQDLSGSTQGKGVIQKVNQTLKFFYRKNSYFNFKEKKMLCTALIQPRFDYGCNSWFGNLYTGLKHKVQTAQNKVMRPILGVHPRFHIGDNSFKKLGWLDTQKRVHYLTVSLVYKIYNGQTPSYMSNMIRVSDRHSYQTRDSEMNFVVPHVKQQEHRGFMYNGIKLWNKLPTDVKSSPSLSIFKRKTKQVYMEEMGALESGIFTQA